MRKRRGNSSQEDVLSCPPFRVTGSGREESLPSEHHDFEAERESLRSPSPSFVCAAAEPVSGERFSETSSSDTDSEDLSRSRGKAEEAEGSEAEPGETESSGEIPLIYAEAKDDDEVRVTSFERPSFDYYLLHGEVYEPKKKPMLSLVFVIHGMADYRRRYDALARALAREGHTTVLFDLRGHGESLLDGQRGFFSYNDGSEKQVDDISMLIAYFRGRYGDPRTYVLGHSLGSLFARAYLKRNPSELSGLLLLGSPAWNKHVNRGWVYSGIVSFFSPLKQAGWLWEKLKLNFFQTEGERKAAADDREVSRGSAGQGFSRGRTKRARGVSEKDRRREEEAGGSSRAGNLRSPRNVQRGFVFKMRAMRDVFDLMREVYLSRNWTVTQAQLPILFLTGKHDRLADVTHSGVKQAEARLRHIGYKNIAARYYENSAHELLFGEDRAQVLADILSFIERGNICF